MLTIHQKPSASPAHSAVTPYSFAVHTETSDNAAHSPETCHCLRLALETWQTRVLRPNKRTEPAFGHCLPPQHGSAPGGMPALPEQAAAARSQPGEPAPVDRRGPARPLPSHRRFPSPQERAAPAGEAKGPAGTAAGAARQGPRQEGFPRPRGPPRARPPPRPGPASPGSPNRPRAHRHRVQPLLLRGHHENVVEIHGQAGTRGAAAAAPLALPAAPRPLGPARFRPLPPTLYISSPGAGVTSPVAEPRRGKRGWAKGGDGERRAGSPAGLQGPEWRRGRPYETPGAAPARPRPAPLAAPRSQLAPVPGLPLRPPRLRP